MTRTHRDDLERLMSEYHRRSIVEAVFGAIKKMYGNHLRGRRLARQKREVAIRIICYNRGGRAIPRKKRQAHTRVTRGISYLTNARITTPSMWGSLRTILQTELNFTVSDSL